MAEIASQASGVFHTRICPSILASLADGVVVADEQGRILFFNPAAGKILGIGPVPSTLEDWPRAHGCFLPDRTTRCPTEVFPLVRAVRGETVSDFELFVRNETVPHGIFISVNGAPLLDERGRPVGGVVVFRDVTERKRLLDELDRKNRKLEEASRRKSEFVASMSHELRTPLNAIIGFSEIVHDGRAGAISAQQKEFLGDILTSSQHLLRIVNDVLDLAKVEAGKMDFHAEPIELEALVQEVRDVLGALAAAKRIRIETEVDPALGVVHADPSRLKQVLYNYLSNALKFTGDGGRVVVRALREGADAFRVEVEDTGAGMKREDLERIFVDFHQLETSRGGRQAGTGLGLALTKRLAEAQGGQVGVESEPGRGSVFHIVLPRFANGEESAPRPGAPTILVVEADEGDRAWLARTLSRAGYAVQTAASGAEAIARCQERTFDAVTLDLLLPDASGWNVLRAMRAGGPNRNTPTIVVSVVAEKESAAGFAVQDFLVQPVVPDDLLSSLRRIGASPGGGGPVLVIDDDPESVSVMETVLREAGYRTIGCTDAATGLLASEREAPSAVVVDLLMPGLDGFGFLERFKKSPQGRAPVIVWTGKDLTASERARLESSAELVVDKLKDGMSVLLESLQAHVPSPGGARGR
ncbi:response regulator [bacterium]|nr:response regulator [bacterium]